MMSRRISLTLVLLLVVQMLYLLPGVVEPVRALNGFIDPNADGSAGAWSSTGASRYTEVDEAVRQPTVPTLSDNISASANGNGNAFLRMSSIVGSTLATQVTVWIYHNDGANGQIQVQLYDDNETTTRSSASNLTQSASNAWHSVTFSSLSLTQAQLDSLAIALEPNKNGGGSPSTITVYAVYADVTYSSTPPTFEQSAYRIFNSINSTNVGTPLAGINAPAVLNAGGDSFRIRMLIHLTGADISTNGQTFKLQYVDRGSGSCSAPSGGTPASYADVTAGTIIAYDNLTGGVSDGDPLTANANDPTHGGDTIRPQTVEEANNFTNSQSGILIGQDAMWDFALQDNTAPSATTYCFRAVESSGTVLSTYSQYPQITTGNGVLAVDIVDGTGASVASPSFALSSTSYLFTCGATTSVLGDTAQRIDVSNFTATAPWTATIAATGGATSVWSDGGSNSYDFNDASGTPAGCGDGGDADALSGQLSIDPSIATVTPRVGCSSTGISLGSASAFNEGVTDSITLFSASSSAQLGCSWQLTGAGLTQQIPSDQASGNYSINFTVTVTAI